ncbi:MAG: c-type cytochrome [Rubrivivax sp.]|jgi:cytochrome c553
MTPKIAFLLATVTALAAPLAHAQDAKAGEAKAAMCIGCHGIPGYQASFPEVHRVPMISGQNAKYIVAALQAYGKGERKHPTMRGISATLTEADMADLGAFYEQHGAGKSAAVAETPPAPPADVAALLAKGNCASCHGVNYNKPIDPSYPKIAGQHADYLAVALKSYLPKNSNQVGRGNAIMAGQVAPFKPAELRAMARYIGSLPGDLKTVPQPKFR